MFSKLSVKKPYTVIVGIILAIVLGYISFTHMSTDLLPSMNLPYVVVYTPYPGATPEQVETDITRPMESAFATLTDIKKITSQSRDNTGVVIMQFNDGANMDTALIEISSRLDQLRGGWDDDIGAPVTMKLNPDMLPVAILSVSRDDMDIQALSDYVNDELVPGFEALNGVASATANGVIEQEVAVTIDQNRIDIVNSLILTDVDAELAEAESEINRAQAQISDGKRQLARAREEAYSQLAAAEAQLIDGEGQIAPAIEQMSAQRETLAGQRQELADSIQAMESVINMTDEQKAAVQEAARQLAELKQQKTGLEARLAALEEAGGSEALITRRADALAQKETLVGQKNDIQAYIDDLRLTGAESLNADISRLNAAITDAEASLSEKQGELSELTARRDALRARIAELDARILAQPSTSPTPTPTATPSASPEATPSASPEATPSASPDATPSVSPDATPSASPDATPSASPDATPSVSPDAAPSASPDIASALTVAGASASPDASPAPDSERTSPAPTGGLRIGVPSDAGSTSTGGNSGIKMTDGSGLATPGADGGSLPATPPANPETGSLPGSGVGIQLGGNVPATTADTGAVIPSETGDGFSGETAAPTDMEGSAAAPQGAPDGDTSASADTTGSGSAPAPDADSALSPVTGTDSASGIAPVRGDSDASDAADPSSEITGDGAQGDAAGSGDSTASEGSAAQNAPDSHDTGAPAETSDSGEGSAQQAPGDSGSAEAPADATGSGGGFAQDASDNGSGGGSDNTASSGDTSGQSNSDSGSTETPAQDASASASGSSEAHAQDASGSASGSGETSAQDASASGDASTSASSSGEAPAQDASASASGSRETSAQDASASTSDSAETSAQNASTSASSSAEASAQDASDNGEAHASEGLASESSQSEAVSSAAHGGESAPDESAAHGSDTSGDGADGKSASDASENSAVEETASEAPENSAVEETASEAPGNSIVEETTSEAPGNSAVEETASEAPGNSVVEETTSEAPGNSAVEETTSDGEGRDSSDEDGRRAFAGWLRANAEEGGSEVPNPELDAAREELDAVNAEIEAKTEEIRQIQSELDDHKRQLDEKQRALEALTGGGGEVSAQVAEAQAKMAELDERIAPLDQEIADIDAKLAAGGGDAGQMSQQLAALDAQIKAIEESDAAKAAAMLQEPDKLNAQYAQAQGGLAEMDAGIEKLDTSIDKLKKGIIPGGLIPGVDEDTDLTSARAELAAAEMEMEEAFSQASSMLAKAQKEINKARKEFIEKRDEALEDAGIDGVITVQIVAQILGAQNLSMPAGYAHDARDEKVLVRVGEKFESINDLKRMKLFDLELDHIPEVRLMDVANIEVTDDRKDVFTKLDGRDGILLSLEKQSTFSTADVAKTVLAHAKALQAANPQLHIVDLMNQGEYIEIVVQSVLQNLLSGGGLAILVLLLFLLDWRPTLTVAFSIPVSVVIAFVCMYFTGINLNVLSLSGLSLGIGMLVDNSIVSIENIYRLHDEERLPLLRACVEGVRSVSGALFSSTLTTICVFLPIVFVQGMARDLFADMGLTIAYSLLASLVVAMTVVPMMCSFLMRRSKPKKHRIFSRLQAVYGAMLRGALRIKPLVLLAALSVLVLAGMEVSKMGISFMPEVNSRQMSANLAINNDLSTAEQQEQASRILADMMEIKGIQSIGLTNDSSSILTSGDGYSYYIIVDENAGVKNVDIARRIEAIGRRYDADLTAQASTMDISMMTGSGISAEITGDDIETLQAIARDVAKLARETEGTTDVSDGLEDAVPELRIIVNKEAAINEGVTAGQLYGFIAQKLLEKTEVSKITLDGKEMKVQVIEGRNLNLRPEAIKDLEMEVELEDEDNMVRIGDVSTIRDATSLSTINRSAQRRMVAVSFEVADGYSSNHVSNAFAEKLKTYQLPAGYKLELTGENETVMGILEDLIWMILVAILLIFLIMVAQFQSFKSPIIVMFTIPLAFTGGLMALLLTHMDLSIVAMLGFLVLSGVVVNNGIVFIDCVNQLRIDGMEKRDALVEAGRQRLRPILMTAMTTILGMSTMALGHGTGAEMMQPMAVVSIGGLSYATLMTLFVVPVLYDLFNGRQMKAREIQMIREAAGMNGDDLPEGAPAPAPSASAPVAAMAETTPAAPAAAWTPTPEAPATPEPETPAEAETLWDIPAASFEAPQEEAPADPQPDAEAPSAPAEAQPDAAQAPAPSGDSTEPDAAPDSPPASADTQATPDAEADGAPAPKPSPQKPLRIVLRPRA